MEEKQEIQEAIDQEDIHFLVDFLFGYKLTETQGEIVAAIAFSKYKKLSISAMTRYGKSFCVAIGIAIFIILNENKKIAFIAPNADQAEILRNYMAELIVKCSILLDLAELESDGDKSKKLIKEASRRRQTFRNGCEYRVFSAHGTAERIMGFGSNVLVLDEFALISRTAWAKIVRMLGDDPENAILIELFNPWDRDTIAFDHSIDPKFKKFHIGYEIGLEESRTTEEFIEDRRKDLTPIEFTVLYESKFPTEAEDSIFSLVHIQTAITSDINLSENYTKRIIGLDVGDKGVDKTAIFQAFWHENVYHITDVYFENKSENMEIVGRIIDFIRKYPEGDKIEVNVDCIGVGVGVVSRLKEVIKIQQLKNVKVIPCHYGEQAIAKDKYANKKAENYFRLRSLFRDGMIKIPDHKDLIKQLMAMKWSFNSSSKIRIDDPEGYSPDFADGLVYTIFKGKQEFAYLFG